jgi:hypothetical protein
VQLSTRHGHADGLRLAGSEGLLAAQHAQQAAAGASAAGCCSWVERHGSLGHLVEHTGRCTDSRDVVPAAGPCTKLGEEG